MKFVFIALIYFACFSIHAETRKYSNEFLSIGVGARALGMANVQTAIVNDVTSGFWNPAGLNLVKNDFQLALMHAEYFAGIGKYDYGSVAIPIKDQSRVVGLSIIRFGVDNIPNTLFLVEPNGSINYNNITSFSVADYAFLFSYAQKIKIKEKEIKVGANTKIVHRRAGDFARAWGFGLDFGAQYELKNWKFGLMAKDITSTFNAWSFSFTDEEKDVLLSTGNELPESSIEITLPRVILGAAYYKAFAQDKFGILAATDIDLTTDGKRNTLVKTNLVSIDPKIGIEANYKKFVFLRFGMGNIQKATRDFTDETITLVQPNIGMGLKIRNFYIDYALSRLNTSLPVYSHFFSLKVDIDKSTKVAEF